MPVPAREQVFECLSCLIPISDRVERIDVPECADEKRVLRHPKIVRDDVAEYEVAALQLAADRAHRRDEAWIVVGDEKQLVQPQQARVERIAVERRDERSRLRVPGALHDLLVQLARGPTPVGLPVLETELPGDSAQPLTSGPAHHRRERVSVLRAAQLPPSGVGFVEKLEAALAQRLEPAE